MIVALSHTTSGSADNGVETRGRGCPAEAGRARREVRVESREVKGPTEQTIARWSGTQEYAYSLRPRIHSNAGRCHLRHAPRRTIGSQIERAAQRRGTPECNGTYPSLATVHSSMRTAHSNRPRPCATALHLIHHACMRDAAVMASFTPSPLTVHQEPKRGVAAPISNLRTEPLDLVRSLGTSHFKLRRGWGVRAWVGWRGWEEACV